MKTNTKNNQSMAATLSLSLLIISAGGMSLTGCSSKDDEQPKKVEQTAGRSETKNIRNLDHIGYSGSAIGKKVDGALNASDENRKKVEEQSVENSNGPAPEQPQQ